MSKVSGETIVEQLNWRYAVKKFDPTKKISAQDWKTLEESLRLSASSFGLQPWNFIVVQNPELRKKLTPASWNQQQIEAASHLVVLTSLKTVKEENIDKYIQHMAKVRGIGADNLKGFRDMMVGSLIQSGRADIATWTAKQTYIAMGTFLTTAALLGVDACPMEGIEPTKYDEILDLKGSQYTTTTVITAGYRAADDQSQKAKKVRFDKDDVIKVLA